jgi:hypothetical protein
MTQQQGVLALWLIAAALWAYVLFGSNWID